MNKYNCNQIPLRVHGRTDGATYPIALFWTGACVELNVTGSALDFEFETSHNGGEIYVRIEIDGADMYRFMLPEGRHTLPIFRNFPAEEVKNVRIFRENQASESSLAIYSFSTDGEFHEVEKRPLIEFFGDSVTSGEGLAGARCLNNWIPAVFSCRGNYAIKVAENLGCDWSIVSQSGWGIYCSWDNVPHNNIPSIYDKVCGPVKSPCQLELGASKDMDFTNHKPMIHVINLGTNDSSAFGHPGWVDENGVLHKQRLGEDGKPIPEDAAKVTAAVYNFISKLREKHSESYLLYCYRMGSGLLDDAIKAAVDLFETNYNDTRIALLKIPAMGELPKGSRNHPGPEAHDIYSKVVTAKIKELGWI